MTPPVTTLGHPAQCWRCLAKPVQLYRDPMFSHTDPIGVCFPCAQARHTIAVRYATLGTRLPVDRRCEPLI